MGFLDKLLKQNNGQSTTFGRLVEKIGTGVKLTTNDLLGDALGSVKDVVNGVAGSLSDAATSKANRNSLNKDSSKYFHQKEVSIANLHGDAILNILKGVTDGNLISAGLQALQLYNYGTKWAIYTDQYVDKEMYPFRYAYLAENSSTSSFLDESETSTPSIQLLDSIEDPTILGYTVKFDFNNSPLFDLADNSAHKTSALAFVQAYQQQHPEMSACEVHLRNLVEDFKKVFESPESLSDTTMYQSSYKQHYIMGIEGLQKLDNPFVKFDEDELKLTLHEDVRMFTNKMAYTYRNLVYSYALGKELIPENLLRFNMYIKISDQRSFTRSTNEKDAMRDAMRNAYSRIIYELKDCQLYFDNPLKDMNMAGFGSVDSSYAQVTMRIKYRKVNRIFYGSLYDKKFSDFIISDKFHRPDDKKAYDFLNETKFEDRRISEKGADSSKRLSTNNNIAVVNSLSSQYSTLKSRGLFTNDDNDSALTRFIKTLGNKAVEKGLTYVDEGLDKVEKAIDNLGLSIRDKLQGLIGSTTTSLGNVNTGFSSFSISQPSTTSIDVSANSSVINNPIGNLQTPVVNTNAAIGLQNLSGSPIVNAPISLQGLNYGIPAVYGISNINLNGNVGYVSVAPVGLNYLMSPATQAPPLTKEDDLMIAAANSNPIALVDLMEPSVVDSNIKTIDDLMIGYDDSKPIGLHDLMIPDVLPNSPGYVDLMIANQVDINLVNPVDLMVPDKIDNSLNLVDLMEPLNNSLPINKVDLMIVESDTKPLKVKKDLMVNDIAENPIKVSVDLMVPDEITNSLDEVDLMVVDSNGIEVPKGSLMVNDSKENNLITKEDLMIADDVSKEFVSPNLMNSFEPDNDPIKGKLMEAGANENHIILDNLMIADSDVIDTPIDNLMNAESIENDMIYEDLMVAEKNEIGIDYQDLMIADKESHSIDSANLMKSDITVENIGYEDLMIAKENDIDITQENLMVVEKSLVKEPDSPNMMKSNSFKKYLKKK